jgi:2,3-bisphosphoglycerate-independent phosphoglycerate mutase
VTTPIALIVLDGFGLAPADAGNAVARASTPHFDALWASHPHTTLAASGEAVGLPPGQMGNSEVGHLNLGAGRIVPQSLSFIQAAFDRGDFHRNPTFAALASDVIARGSTLHLLGLVSDGGVHADLRHVVGLIAAAAAAGVPRLIVHAFSDGRDTAPHGGRAFVAAVEAALATYPGEGRIGSVIGRYTAMDRDRRWERTGVAWAALVHGRAEHRAASGVAAVEAAYARGESDEFIAATLVGDDATIRDGDGVFFFNFRADRARQLLHAFVDPEPWAGFDRGRVPRVALASLMELDASRSVPFALALPPLTEPLGEVIERAGLRQFHAAETEKYPHVTYFFNAKREEPYVGETRYLEPSPKVATYDLQPEMSAAALAAACAARIRAGGDDFVLINFANPDMVGHTGDLTATIAACEATDAALGVVMAALVERGGATLIVADHGNAERMIAEDGGPHTAHTTNPVPCILVGGPAGVALRSGGVLGDVAPTLLALLGVAQPAVMTGRSLLG